MLIYRLLQTGLLTLCVASLTLSGSSVLAEETKPAKLRTPIHSEHIGSTAYDGLEYEGEYYGDVEYVGDGSLVSAPQPELFYNYYVGPGPNGTFVGHMYPTPLPVPPHVGHTYFTYPPLYPHHYLQPHTLYYTNGSREVHVEYRHHGGRRWIWYP